MDKIKTPYFLINKEELDCNYNKFYQAFKKYWGNIIIGYSVKTNSLPWIIYFLEKKGAYAEVVSSDEYELVRKLGYFPKNIIYNGPVKSYETFKESLKGKGIVNIDSLREIEWLKKITKTENSEFRVGVRINFDLEKDCPGETSSLERGGRFGFNYENKEFEKAIKVIKKLKNIKIVGVHLHTSTKTRSLKIYKTLSEKAVEIKEILGNNIEYIDIGGGFFGGLKDKPQYIDYAKIICDTLKKAYTNKVKLIVEPGSSLIASPISFISEVISLKNVKENRIVTINGSCNNLNPLMNRYKKYIFKIKHKNKKNNIKIKNQIIVGYTCMENDELFNITDDYELNIGDKIIFYNVGSYTSTLSPLFIEFFPDVLVKSGGKYTYARKRWTVKEFLQNNYIK